MPAGNHPEQEGFQPAFIDSANHWASPQGSLLLSALEKGEGWGVGSMGRSAVGRGRRVHEGVNRLWKHRPPGCPVSWGFLVTSTCLSPQVPHHKAEMSGIKPLASHSWRVSEQAPHSPLCCHRIWKPREGGPLAHGHTRK